MSILTPDHGKSHFKFRRRIFWPGSDENPRLILTPKERALALAIVAVVVVAIALVVLIEH